MEKEQQKQLRDERYHRRLKEYRKEVKGLNKALHNHQIALKEARANNRLLQAEIKELESQLFKIDALLKDFGLQFYVKGARQMIAEREEKKALEERVLGKSKNYK